jgi:PPE family
MPDEADGVYIDDLGTVGRARTGPTPSTLGISDMIAAIAAQSAGIPCQAPGADQRVAPMPEGVLYENVDHPTLKAMVTEGVDPDQVGSMAAAWQTAGAKLTQFQDDVASAINTSRGEWQGVAGDMARQFIAGVGLWIGEAGRGAQLAGNQAAKHSEALAAARNAMPEPVPFDVNAANAELRSITDPVQLITRYAAHMEAYAAQQAAQRRAAEVVTAYDTALSESATMPAFAPPPAMAGAAPSMPGAPMPRVSHDPPVSSGGSTTPQSASSGSSSIPVQKSESTAPQGIADDSSPQATAVPMTGGFAVTGIDSGVRGIAPVAPAVLGGLAAANHVADGDDEHTPPVIGG